MNPANKQLLCHLWLLTHSPWRRGCHILRSTEGSSGHVLVWSVEYHPCFVGTKNGFGADSGDCRLIVCPYPWHCQMFVGLRLVCRCSRPVIGVTGFIAIPFNDPLYLVNIIAVVGKDDGMVRYGTVPPEPANKEEEEAEDAGSVDFF